MAADIGTLTVNLVFTQTYDKRGGDIEKQVKLSGNNTSTMDVATNKRLERLEKEIELLNKELLNLKEEKRQKDIESYGDTILLLLKRALSGGIFSKLDVMNRNTIESELFARISKWLLNFSKGRAIQDLNVEKDPERRRYLEEVIKLIDRNIESIDQQRAEKAENRNRRSDVLGERIKILEEKIKLKLDELNELKPLLEGNYDAQMTFGILGFGDEGVGNLAQRFLDFSQTVNTATGAQDQYSQSLLDVVKNANDGAVIFGYTADALEGVSGATSDVTNKVNALGKNGINPLIGSTEESGEAVIDLVSSLEAGAVVFGYTTKDVLKYQAATEGATKSTENLGKDGIKGVVDQAKQAEKKLDSLGSSTEGIKENAETLDKTLKEGSYNRVWNGGAVYGG